MVDSYTRRLSIVAVGDEPDVLVGDGVAIEQGLADVVSLHRRSRATAKDPDEEEQARRLVDKRLRTLHGLDSTVQTRRLAGMLARKGYPPGIAWSVVRAEVGAECSGDD